MTQLLLAVLAFVGSHFLLSHGLRRALVGKLGLQAYLGVYSLVSASTLIWVVLAYRAAPYVMIWPTQLWAFHLVHAVMLFALILLAGSLIRLGPALPMMEGQLKAHEGPKGVQAITRHPMMWAIALWAIAHGLVNGDAAMLVLCAGMAVLALAGSAGQDRRKMQEIGADWADYAARTSFWPFGLQLSGRAGWRSAWPGGLPVIGGILAFAILAGGHRVFFGVSPFAGF